MSKGTLDDRVAVMEMLIEMMIREMPDGAQEELMDRLIDRTTGAKGWDEFAHDWDERVLRDRSMSRRSGAPKSSARDLKI